MPTYQYQCKNCGYTFEELQYITEDPLVTCPQCHMDSLARIIGTGAGVIFRGTGFYLTDYGKSSTPSSAKKAGKGASEGSASPAGESSKPSGGKPGQTKEKP